MSFLPISSEHAPSAIGTYSQAVRVDNTVYLSGQIPLHPQTMEIVDGLFEEQVNQVFENLTAVAVAAGGGLSEFVKLNIFLIDLSNFSVVNEVMARFFNEPYPARAVVEVSALPRNAEVEMDAIMYLAGSKSP